MIPQSKAKIFLSSNRELTQLDDANIYECLKQNKFSTISSGLFGELKALNEIILKGGGNFNFTTDEELLIILLPIVGAIVYNATNSNSIIEAGQAQYFAVGKNAMIDIHNPYENNEVGFLMLYLKNNFFNTIKQTDLFSFDLNKDKNKLISLFHANKTEEAIFRERVFIGMFDGRHEAIHKTENGNGVFAFVIQGAFEVQYRLIEMGDGLALPDEKEIELEALSNDAIILLVDMML